MRIRRVCLSVRSISVSDVFIGENSLPHRPGGTRGQNGIWGSGKERFQINTFLPVIDTLKESLERRAKLYNDIFARFGFLSALKGMTRDDIQQKCDFLVRHYASDFSTDELVSECLHFKEYLTVT